jgi:hypothetical protein
MSNLLRHKSIAVSKPTRGHQPEKDSGAIRCVIVSLAAPLEVQLVGGAQWSLVRGLEEGSRE